MHSAPSIDQDAARTGRVAAPELLAPAGDWMCVRAAVENGADAVYFGLEKFNARARAHNFTTGDLPELMAFLHRRGVRGYVTFNTLVFECELSEAEAHLRSIISAGVDAAIVQDVGICRLIRRLSPDFPIHASTQMTLSSVGGIEFARELGCDLAVLARECSVGDIERIQAAQQDLSSAQSSSGNPSGEQVGATPLPLEVFVHGALCVAYSGQCLTSEVLGGRSANRGECAQACRLPYELISDGRTVELGDRHYLLSPQDLAGISVLPELMRAGVTSFKIEGRLKSPEYVAAVTRAYRDAIDCLMIDREESQPAVGEQLFRESKHDLEMSFSRGLFTGWLRGNDNQRLVHARFGKKRGVLLGEVLRVEKPRILVCLDASVKAGDGIVFDHGKPEAGEEGGRIYGVSEDRNSGPRNPVWLTFGRGAIDFGKVHAGDGIWKTSDPDFDRRVRQTFDGEGPRFQRGISMSVRGQSGGPLTLVARDESGRSVEVTSQATLCPAENRPLTEAWLEKQLSRLGGTPFKLESIHVDLPADVILPVSEVNRLRREAVERLQQMRSEPIRWPLSESRQVPRDEKDGTSHSGGTPDSRLVVLTRSLAQLEAALECGIRTLYCDYENPKRYRDAVGLVRRGGSEALEVFVAPPRIFKTGEEWILHQVRSSEADGYLVRNYDHLRFFAADRKIGDFSLNIANSLSAGYFKERYGLEHLTASYDLNAGQLDDLLRAAPPHWFEVTLHQHMPMFHMEHCVFCAFLSEGKDYRDCGRPCDRHEVKLRDRVGMEHPLKADVGCRNTVFNARAQTGAEFLPRLRELGVSRFRIEFVNETPAEVRTILASYQKLLRNEVTGTELWRELRIQNQLGVTRGQMAN